MMQKPNSQSLARTGFTLVELLVVITIIAILAGLLLAAASGALGKGEEARIKAQIGQMNGAFEDYKNTLQGYPPTTQTDANADNQHLANAKILSAFKRHLKKAYPSHRENDSLIEALVGAGPASPTTQTPNLLGGMNAAEALVFFLTKMSDDPRYPISGVGGPSYSLGNSNAVDVKIDPIDNRSWWLEPNTQSLGPRAESKFFDETDERYIVYVDPQDSNRFRQINFWYLKDQSDFAPYLYFDVSRGADVTAANDPPALTMQGSDVAPFEGADSDALNQLLYVHPIKRPNSNSAATNPFIYANKGKFQILHPGRDEAWGVLPMVNPTDSSQLIASEAYHNGSPTTLLSLVFPDGPWTLDLADTLTNFTDGTLSDAQP